MLRLRLLEPRPPHSSIATYFVLPLLALPRLLEGLSLIKALVCCFLQPAVSCPLFSGFGCPKAPSRLAPPLEALVAKSKSLCCVEVASSSSACAHLKQTHILKLKPLTHQHSLFSTWLRASCLNKCCSSSGSKLLIYSLHTSITPFAYPRLSSSAAFYFYILSIFFAFIRRTGTETSCCNSYRLYTTFHSQCHRERLLYLPFASPPSCLLCERIT